MDFANEHVGFGTTGTQEELLLGMSPETCPIVLFNEILGDKDALMITGMLTASAIGWRKEGAYCQLYMVMLVV